MASVFVMQKQTVGTTQVSMVGVYVSAEKAKSLNSLEHLDWARGMSSTEWAHYGAVEYSLSEFQLQG